jgi:RNA polymerase sigma-70 factor (ECF subfamily)
VDGITGRRRGRAVSRHERLLAAGLARGEETALRAIEDEYSGVLRGYLRQLLRDEASADDVLQQVMLEAWQRGTVFDPQRGSILAWLMTIARSRAIDQLRRRVPEPSDPRATAALIDARAPDEDRAGELAERWRIAHLLTQLPRQEAQLLRMRFELEMSQTEIAKQTGLPLGTVKMRMVSALERMRGLMDGEGEAR